MLQGLRAQVGLLKNVAKAQQMMKFFKTGQGEYGFGDFFIGLTNPQCRTIAKNHQNMTFNQVQILLHSKIHEQRAIALMILDLKYKNKKQDHRTNIFQIYVKHMECVNNWDLVDLSAPNIVGKYLLQNCTSFEEMKDINDKRKYLYQWARSPNLWFRRISIISTFTFIRANHFYDTIQIAKILLNQKQDIIHKATGWMLREVGSRQLQTLQTYLKQNYKNIPRTTLRYAIQKFPQTKRKDVLKGKLEVLGQN